MEKLKQEIGNGEQKMEMVLKGIYYVMGNRNKMYRFHPSYQISNGKQKNEMKHMIYMSLEE